MSIGEYPSTRLGLAGLADAGPGGTGPGSGGLSGAGGTADLSGRLTALARVIQIGAARSGPEGFSPPLLTEAEQLVARARWRDAGRVQRRQDNRSCRPGPHRGRRGQRGPGHQPRPPNRMAEIGALKLPGIPGKR